MNKDRDIAIGLTVAGIAVGAIGSVEASENKTINDTALENINNAQKSGVVIDQQELNAREEDINLINPELDGFDRDPGTEGDTPSVLGTESTPSPDAPTAVELLTIQVVDGTNVGDLLDKERDEIVALLSNIHARGIAQESDGIALDFSEGNLAVLEFTPDTYVVSSQSQQTFISMKRTGENEDTFVARQHPTQTVIERSGVANLQLIVENSENGVVLYTDGTDTYEFNFADYEAAVDSGADVNFGEYFKKAESAVNMREALGIDTLSDADVETITSIVESTYPFRDITRLVEYSTSVGITITGWNSQFNALEGVNQNNETLYFFPRVGTMGGRGTEVYEEDCLTDGWTRLGDTLRSDRHNVSINLFTSQNFVYADQPHVLRMSDEMRAASQANPEIIDNMVGALIRNFPEQQFEGKQINVVLMADDLTTKVPTSQSELSSLLNTWGGFDFAVRNSVVAGTSALGTSMFNRVSIIQQGQYAEPNSMGLSAISGSLITTFMRGGSYVNKLNRIQPLMGDIIFPVYYALDANGSLPPFIISPVGQ